MDRPKISEAYIARAAAEDILPELMQWAEAGESERANYLNDAISVMEDARHKNGYELARDLERGGYEPDARLVEILDGAYSLLSDRYRRAVKEWVKGWNITVPHVVGQTARVKYRGREVSGKIVSIKPDEAVCIVHVAELGHSPNGGLVINSEEVLPEAVAVEV